MDGFTGSVEVRPGALTFGWTHRAARLLPGPWVVPGTAGVLLALGSLGLMAAIHPSAPASLWVYLVCAGCMAVATGAWLTLSAGWRLGPPREVRLTLRRGGLVVVVDGSSERVDFAELEDLAEDGLCITTGERLVWIPPCTYGRDWQLVRGAVQQLARRQRPGAVPEALTAMLRAL